MSLGSHDSLKKWVSACGSRVAFLRYNVAGLEHREGSDWDVAVRDLETVRKTTRSCFGAPWLDVRRTYVEQRYYPWGQLDLLPAFQWNGLTWLNQDRFWKGVSVGKDGIPRPRLAHDALIALLTGLLSGKTYRSRYNPLVELALKEDREEFRDCLCDVVGESFTVDLMDILEGGRFEEIEPLAVEVRWGLFYQRIIRGPGELLEGVARHWIRELALHLSPPHPWIAFLGPDGAGKTTLLDKLGERLARSRLKSRVVHWCPRLRGESEEDGQNPVTDPHGKTPRGFFLSTLSLGFVCFRWMVARFGPVWHQRAKQKVLISDRYYSDLLVDPRRYRYGGSLNLARFCFRFLPKPDLTVVLCGEVDDILKRKNEVTCEELERQLDAYRRLAGTLPSPAVVIDAGKGKDEVFKELFEELEQKVFTGRS